MLLTCSICLDEFDDTNFFDNFFEESYEKRNSLKAITIDCATTASNVNTNTTHDINPVHNSCQDADDRHQKRDETHDSPNFQRLSSCSTKFDNALVRISRDCCHSFCIDCLNNYCLYTVEKLETIPIPCPKNEKHAIDISTGIEAKNNDVCCSSFISDHVVRRIMIASTAFEHEPEQNLQKSMGESGDMESFWNRYEKLCLIQANNNSKGKYVSCPKCDDLLCFCPKSVIHEATDNSGAVSEVFSSYTCTTWTSDTSNSPLSAAENVYKMHRLNQIDPRDDEQRIEHIFRNQEILEDTCNLSLNATTNTWEGDAIGTSTLNNFVTCATCHHYFCGYHGDAHTDSESCLQYLTTPDYLASQNLIQQSAKYCSHCNAPISKTSGCDHVVCTVCKNDMCYACNSHLHLSGTMIRSCSKCKHSYRDHRYNLQYKTRLCFLLPVLIPFIILYMVVSTMITIVSGCFCCCFYCGSALPPKAIESSDQQPEAKPEQSRNNISKNSHTTVTLDRVTNIDSVSPNRLQEGVNDIEFGGRHGAVELERDNQGINGTNHEVIRTSIEMIPERNRQLQNKQTQFSAEKLINSVGLVTNFVFFPFLLLLHEFGLIPALNNIAINGD